MTSDSNPSAAPSEPCESCPGPAGCYLARMEPRSAYIAGCRAPIARDANTAYSRERRAQKRAQGLTGPDSEWDTPEPASGPEPTGELCQQCREPLTWTVSRAGQVCANGHFRLPPDTAELAAGNAASMKRAALDSVSSRQTVIDTARLDAERGRIIRQCESALAELDTTQLDEIAASVPAYNRVYAWSEETAYTLRDVFGSLIKQAHAARSRDELANIDTARGNVYVSSEMNNTRSLIHQEYRDTAQLLTNISQGTARFRVEPGNPTRIQRIAAPAPAAPAAPEEPRRIPGARIRDYTALPETRISPLASFWDVPKAIGRSYTDDSRDEGYADEEWEEKPRRVIYDDNESHGNAMLYFVGAIMLCALGMWAYSQARTIWSRDGFYVCENPDHSGRPALARENWTGAAGSVNVCHREECRAWAHSRTLFTPGYGEPIEPRSGALLDAAGIPGYTVNGRGRYRKNRGFAGAQIQ